MSETKQEQEVPAAAETTVPEKQEPKLEEEAKEEPKIEEQEKPSNVENPTTEEKKEEAEEKTSPPTETKTPAKDGEVKLPKDPNSKYFPEFEKALPSQEGKFVAITGTTSGTGNVAARTSLLKKAQTIMLNRNVEKAQKSLEEFFKSYPELKANAFYVECDLQDFGSATKAAEAVREIIGDKGLNVLCNNAGVMALADVATKDGYDVQMQTNHLSHFLLTKELYPLLELAATSSGEARIINHSSTARLGVSALRSRYLQKNGGKLGGNSNGMMTGARWTRYEQTKLANSVFTSELQKRLTAANSNVAAYCAHPGLAATNLQITTQKDGGLKSLNFMKSSQSAEDGAMGILRGMFAPKDTLKKGAIYGPRFFTGKATQRYHGMGNTAAAGRMLWRESEKACGEFVIAASAKKQNE